MYQVSLQNSWSGVGVEEKQGERGKCDSFIGNVPHGMDEICSVYIKK